MPPTAPQDDDSGPLPRLFRDREGEPAGEAATRRRQAEAAGSAPLVHVAGAPVPPAATRGKVENCIGFAQVPLGLAGPLMVDGEAGRYEVYVPLATTEGAMVASYSRGMSVLREAGGVRARVVAEGLSQHPVLVYRDASGAEAAAALVPKRFESWRALVATTTRHGALVRARGEVFGRRLVLRLVFTTGDAIGINMAARAAELVSQDLAAATSALERHVHGQDVEKRANARALVEGRGRSAVADAIVPRELLARRLRTTPEALVGIARTYAAGYAQLGTQNWTIQAANGLAALFLACGQDVAYVVESATGYLDLDLTAEGDLYAGVHLPSLLLGTVGGGSGQGTALECLSILGCVGDGKARRFAEIAAATVLAGDLSLLASFAAGDFVDAHERLGRNRPEAPRGPRPQAP